MKERVVKMQAEVQTRQAESFARIERMMDMFCSAATSSAAGRAGTADRAVERGGGAEIRDTYDDE